MFVTTSWPMTAIFSRWQHFLQWRIPQLLMGCGLSLGVFMLGLSAPTFTWSQDASAAAAQDKVHKKSALAPAKKKAPTHADFSQKYHFVKLKFNGLKRTDERWLESYIDYPLPTTLSTADLLALEEKLLTTGAFLTVSAKAVPLTASEIAADKEAEANSEDDSEDDSEGESHSGAKDDAVTDKASRPAASASKVPALPAKGAVQDYVLNVTIEERWTTIPVLRAAYGGGTPVKVLGLYDIHSFGRLITLGGEARQYGAAPPGFALYFRDPRGDSNRYYFGGEIWREFRRRDVFDDKGHDIGELGSNMTLTRFRLLLPTNGRDKKAHDHNWKIGGDLEVLDEAPSFYNPSSQFPQSVAPASLPVADKTQFSVKILPTVLYDDIRISHIEYHGERFKLKYGPAFSDGHIFTTDEVEAYYYHLLPHHLNFGMRAVAGESTYNSLQSTYFLGGLDTIRGLPDGAIYGTRAAFTNIEMRHLSAQYKYLWIQSAAFVDAGAAGSNWSNTFDSPRASAGFGFRLAVPQIYRFVIRVDYAWSFVGPKTQGVTAGVNQFFDPYIPL